MKPWTIGLSTGCFYSRPILDVLDEIRASGFGSIEVCSFPAHLDYHNHQDVAWAAARIHGLRLNPISFHAPFAEKIDITALDPAARAGAVCELLAACDAAKVLGVKNIVLHPGPECAGRRDDAEFLVRTHNAAAVLNIVAERCCQLQLHLILENMLPHLLFGHTSDMLYLLGSIRNCEVGACLDTGHAFLARELDSVIQKLSGHLHLVHLNDNRGDRDEHLPPGDGHIDWPRVLHELHRCQFSGTLILELSLRENESVQSMLERARRSRDYLLNLMENIQP
jgi:sugar phosphate isomerase/epimerase